MESAGSSSGNCKVKYGYVEKAKSSTINVGFSPKCILAYGTGSYNTFGFVYNASQGTKYHLHGVRLNNSSFSSEYMAGITFNSNSISLTGSSSSNNHVSFYYVILG